MGGISSDSHPAVRIFVWICACGGRSFMASFASFRGRRQLCRHSRLMLGRHMALLYFSTYISQVPEVWRILGPLAAPGLAEGKLSGLRPQEILDGTIAPTPWFWAFLIPSCTGPS